MDGLAPPTHSQAASGAGCDLATTATVASGAERLRVQIRGAVQGVGFRPFVYRLATDMALPGWVINDTGGVVVEVEGTHAQLTRFAERLATDKPPRAMVHSVEVAWLAPVGFDHFEIRHSDDQGARTGVVLPDIVTCADCLAEVVDPADRRYRYPFTNCTNCGPRFTIVRGLPYDRPNTTMQTFAMCPACRNEYEQPLDRRFHAQPNACPTCGPHLALWTPTEDQPANERQWSTVATHDEALLMAAARVRAGEIVGVKGLGGFHLVVDAANVEAIARLRARKARPEKPFALMVCDLAQVRRLCISSPLEDELLASPEGPIVLLARRMDAPVADNVAPDNPRLGVMLPPSPLHHLLLREIGRPVVATSGNLSDEPICTDEDEARTRLGAIADCLLVHNRPISRHVDDSVAAVIHSQPRLLRRARGYAPLPVLLPRDVPPILAVGAHLKNTVALSIGRQVFVSQHIGDLETSQAVGAFEQVIGDFLAFYGASPVAISCDEHPDYVSTRWAGMHAGGDGEPRLVPVQHHHAHLAACLAEHNVEGPVLGVTWDGTGYGADGTIWGGEFLLGDAGGYTRVAHLRAFRLPGSAAAVREPARTAVGLLWELLGDAAFAQEALPPCRAFQPQERRLLHQMLARQINSLLTTSAGRFFDAIAALIGLRERVTFEGQAAMLLEAAVDSTERGTYPITITGDQPVLGVKDAGTPPLVLDWQPLVEAILTDLRRGVAPGVIAARFHHALVAAILGVAKLVGVQRVALTGGCFQNRILVEQAAQHLTAAGFEVLLHRTVPPGDGGISLGQVVVAAAQLAQHRVRAPWEV